MKRTIDFLIALCAVIVLSPLLLLVAIAIKLESKGPLFYTQKRLGYTGQVFELLKFRSMTNKEHDPSVQIFGDEMDVTRVGKIIRRLKIDELPQFINVLKGDMSIVGPRPCLPSLQNDFNEDGKARLIVRPGLTGLAQINGNIHLSWEERWKFDRHYVENHNLLLDIKIILNTVLIVVLGEKWGLKK